jgi:hypothetical protein
MGRVPSTLLLAVLVLMAGCTTEERETDDRPPAPGEITGRVLDRDGLPIAGARVLLLLTPHNATTDALGAFRMAGVEPGPAVLVASRPGYSSRTVREDLAPGATLAVEFVLIPAPRVQPHVQTLTFEGLLLCGIAGLGCGPLTPAELPQHPFEVRPGLRGILYELAWAAPAPAAAPVLRVDAAAATAEACGAAYRSATGASVLRLESTSGFPIAGGHQCALVLPHEGLAAQQAYTLHVSLFYHQELAQGYRTIDG